MATKDRPEKLVRKSPRSSAQWSRKACHPSRMTKRLYTTREAEAAGGFKTTTLYKLLAERRLEAVRLGRRTMITAESLEAFIASLPRVTTPAMAKAEHEKWSGHRRPRPKPQEAEPDAVE